MPKVQEENARLQTPSLRPVTALAKPAKFHGSGVDAILNKLGWIENRLEILEQASSSPKRSPSLMSELPTFTTQLPNGRAVTRFHRTPARVAVWLTKSSELENVSENVMHKLELLLRTNVETNCKKNGEEVSLVPLADIQNFRKTVSAKPFTVQEICKQLDADFLIKVELNRFTIYVPGSANTLHQGNTEIELTISTPHGAGPQVAHQEVFSFTFPDKTFDATKGNPDEFQETFMKNVAQQICSRLSCCPGKEKSSEKSLLGQLFGTMNSPVR
jgi:hypothetical protein